MKGLWAVAGNQTVPTTALVETYLAAISDPVKQADARTLVQLMSDVSQRPATMWGPAIVGFGKRHYAYGSGRTGDTVDVGFAARAAGLTIYLADSVDTYADLFAKLGQHKVGKGCLYVKRLADVDVSVLREVVARSVARSRAMEGDDA